MIKDFEEITKPLSEEESQILNIMITAFNSRPKGKQNAITSSVIIEKFKGAGIILTDTRIRKLIQHIRVNNLIFGLCSTSAGYFIAENAQEFHNTLQSLKERIEMQTATFNALKAQYKILYIT